MNNLLAAQILVAALGAGWTVILFFLKRTLRGIDARLEANARAAEELARGLRSSAALRDERVARALRGLAAASGRNYSLLKAEMERGGASLRKETERAVAAQCGECGGRYVSRREFGAFTANMNHKIDSMYEILKQEERTQKR